VKQTVAGQGSVRMGWKRLFEFVPNDDGDADEEEKGSTSDNLN